MIVVLVGESGCGKSSLAKRFIELNPSFSRVVTFTTRPMREGEEIGVDYNFISKEEFETLKAEGFFLEAAQYREWWYGTPKDIFNDGNKIIVLTPAGARALRRYAAKIGSLEHIKVIYLFVDRRSRLINTLKRGDNIEEAYRRSLSDVGQFDSFSDEADIVLRNEQYFFSVDLLCDFLSSDLWSTHE